MIPPSRVQPQPSTVAVYLEDSSASNKSCGPALLKVVNTADAAPTATGSPDTRPMQEVVPPAISISSGPRVGILYEGWHAYAANAMAQVAAKGGQQLTVEQVRAVCRCASRLQIALMRGTCVLSGVRSFAATGSTT